MLQTRTRRWLWTTTVAVLLAGSGLITLASTVYFESELPPFVIEKLPLPMEDVWLRALEVHVLATALCFPACLLLLSTRFLKRYRPAHRWLGRVTGAAILLALIPSGSYLALFAKGGALSTLGFLLSGAIMAAALVLGVATARRGHFAAHRRWMLHVVAQMSVAVSSRAMLMAFDAFAVDPELAYLISLWLPVVGSVLLVEALAVRRRAPAAVPVVRASLLRARTSTPTTRSRSSVS